MIDLTGHKLGRLQVLSEAPRRYGKMRYWNCRCDCGALRTMAQGVLINSNPIRKALSCGCLGKEHREAALRTHGHAPAGNASRTYTVWAGMKNRCLNPNEPAYPDYGGRGITVAERWLSFENFLADMGERPQTATGERVTLGRIDNDGPYAPDNCRWESYTVQANNRRKNHLISHEGKTLTLAQWSKETGLGHTTILMRLKNGWTVERALTTSSRRKQED